MPHLLQDQRKVPFSIQNRRDNLLCQVRRVPETFTIKRISLITEPRSHKWGTSGVQPIAPIQSLINNSMALYCIPWPLWFGFHSPSAHCFLAYYQWSIEGLLMEKVIQVGLVVPSCSWGMVATCHANIVARSAWIDNLQPSLASGFHPKPLLVSLHWMVARVLVG